MVRAANKRARGYIVKALSFGNFLVGLECLRTNIFKNRQVIGCGPEILAEG
jgi:hypothetical protein